MPNLAPGTTTPVTYSGAAVTYTVTAPGVVTLKLWGGAGGQSHWMNASTVSRNSAMAGGGGGYTWLTLRVATNDQIKIEVGQGGRGSTSSPQAPGAGGWPDGGSGAASSVTGNSAYYAGGGGSTRVYLNGTLIAVAGAGGGGGGSHSAPSTAASVSTIGGAGGGASGRSTPTVSTNAGATAGSQIGGGVNNNVPSDTGFQGGSFKGGNGYSSTNATPNTLNAGANMAGPGGGGGYYGGGGCADTGSGTGNVACGGAGGSGYINTANSAVIAGDTYMGYGVLPYGHLDPDYPGSSVGVSPNGTTNGAGLNDGGNGAVVMRFPSQVTLTNATQQVVSFTGGAADYICPSDGNLIVKAWGGAGGGGSRTNALGTSAGASGGGGFVTFKFDVTAGDIITVLVGRGGHRGQDGTTNSGGGKPTALGHGGWPDGGRGSYSNASTTLGNIAYGGGGGSTRIYRNGVLIGVAGAGGGPSGGSNASTLKSGAGGGTTGVNSDNISTTQGGTGGSQSAGGAWGNVPSDTGFQGAFLRGADGSSSTVFDPTRGGGGTIAAKTGPGGGGGYYGGGGAGEFNTTTTALGGGGGSSWWDPSLPNLVNASTTAGLGTTPGGNADPDYGLAGSPGAGVANTTGGDGGNGAAVLLGTFGYKLPGPVTLTPPNAGVLVGFPTGDVGTVTINYPDPAGGVNVGPQPTGAIGTIVVSAVDASAGSQFPLPPIAVQMLLNGQPVQEGVVTAVISESDIDMSLNDPAGSVSSSVDLQAPFPPDPIGPVVMTAPDAAPGAGLTLTALATPLVVTMTAPAGTAETGLSVTAPLPATVITLTPPDGTVTTGFPALFAPLVITMVRPLASVKVVTGTLAFSAPVSLIAPDASVELGVSATATDLPVTVIMTPPAAQPHAPVNFTTAVASQPIIMRPPAAVPISGPPLITVDPFTPITITQVVQAMAEEGIAAEADLTALITLTAPDGAVRADQNAIVDFGPFPILVTPPIPFAQSGILVDNTDPLVIAMDYPTGTAFHAVQLVVTILPAKIIMRAPQGVAFAGEFVVTVGDLDPLVITMTEPDAFVPAQSEAFQVIDMDYVDGYVDVPVPNDRALIKLKRSITTGNRPTLITREIGLNEADGVLFSRDAGGAIKRTPYLGFGKGRLLPAGGADGEVLGVDYAWKTPPSAGGAPAQITPPTTTRVLLANNFLGLNHESPLQTAPAGKFAVHYRPFFLPKATRLTSLAVYQEGANYINDTSVGDGGRVPMRIWLGICGWNPNLEQPGAVKVQAPLDDTSGVGNVMRETFIDVTLPVGWYAAMIGAHNLTYLTNQGFVFATFRAWRGGLAIGETFVPRGEAYGLLDIGSDLSTPPAVVGYVDIADGDIPDHAFVQAVIP